MKSDKIVAEGNNLINFVIAGLGCMKKDDRKIRKKKRKEKLLILRGNYLLRLDYG